MYPTAMMGAMIKAATISKPNTLADDKTDNPHLKPGFRRARASNALCSEGIGETTIQDQGRGVKNFQQASTDFFKLLIK
jgi:hypothetical protein